MKIDGQITFLINRENTTIELRDKNAAIVFAKLELNAHQTIDILSRLSDVECKIELNALEFLGKKHECKNFTFEIPKSLYMKRNNKSDLVEIANNKLTDGWVAEPYFSSQNSFSRKDEKFYATCTIRRWL